MLDVLRERPAGLVSDVDGTLAPIVTRPDEARVEPEAREVLAALAPKLAVVAALTGRAPRRALEMVGVDGLTYLGNHGMEELVGGEVRPIPEALGYEGRAAAVFARLERTLDVEGAVLEDKGVSGAVHYRAAPDPAAALPRILEVLEPLAREQGLVLQQGRMVVEVRPPVELGKGAAIARLVERHSLRGCVFLGDDVTDVDGFSTLRALRAEGRVSSVCVGVLSAETPPAVVELSDFAVEGVPGVVALLGWVAARL